MNLLSFMLWAVAGVVSLSQEGAGNETLEDFNKSVRRRDYEPERKPIIRDLESGTEKSREKFKSLFLDGGSSRIKEFVKKLCVQGIVHSGKASIASSKKFILSSFNCLKMLTFVYVDEVLETIPGRPLIGAKRVRFFVDDFSNDYVEEILSKDWSVLAEDRLNTLIKKSRLKFSGNDDPLLFTEGRGRRKDQRMLALIIMGFMIVASVLIPTGFQFLTVLGGKSLLMAKMALILSAISGLKKIATSNVGYGFYQAAGDDYHHDHIHHGFQEKLYKVDS